MAHHVNTHQRIGQLLPNDAKVDDLDSLMRNKLSARALSDGLSEISITGSCRRESQSPVYTHQWFSGMRSC